MTVDRHHEASLAVTPDQSEFTPVQLAALEHIGIAGAPDGDLQVFHHVVQRTGLDPFARQIYMIPRKTRERVNGEWVDGPPKWTIQTGIDGFRLIGRRAADRAKHKVRVDAPEWGKGDEGWRPWWNREWGYPVAARVTVWRDGEPFTAIALFDEYKQTIGGGRLNSMWEQRPAGQLAKCAEALAWRMAFPQDLSGIYVDEEMHQADNPETHAAAPAHTTVTADVIRGQTSAPEQDEEAPSGPSGADPTDVSDAVVMISDDQSAEIGRLLLELNIKERKAALEYVNDCLPDGRTVRARKDLTAAEAENVLLSLRDDIAKVGTATKSDPWGDVEVARPPGAADA